MGILPCAIACTQFNLGKEEPNSRRQSHFKSNRLECSTSNSSSLASQPSLPSLPSLVAPTPTNTHHRCIATLKGHSSYVFSLAITANHLYSGSSDGEIRCWSSTIDGNWISITPSGKSAVKSILVSGDNILFNAHQDHRIRVWKIIDPPDKGDGHGHNHKLLVTLPTIKDRILRFLPPKNHIQVRRHRKRTWVHHVDAVSGLALSHDGALLYSVSWDRSLKIWRTSDFRCLQSVANAHDDAINAVAVSADGFVYTASADMKIKVWQWLDKTHSLVATLEKHRSAVNALALSSDGSILYSGACDRSIVVWERLMKNSSWAVVGALRGHGKAILCLTVVAEDEVVCSGSADKTVRIWRRSASSSSEKRSYTCLAVLEGHGGPVKCLAAVSSNQQRVINIFSGSLDCDIKVWQLVFTSSSIEEEEEEEINIPLNEFLNN